MSGALRHVVVLTGAGISAESGIATFRASDGLWENHRIEDVATPSGFARNPSLVHRFYNGRRREHEGKTDKGPILPNAAHLALARFAREFQARGDGRTFTLVTQNIDALHERAGSKAVLHMHGELTRVRCSVSGRSFEWLRDCSESDVCSCCGEAGRLRPHVVWFEELPLHLDEIGEALTRADLFASIGTSGNVYPAAGFFQIARRSGARTVELNLEPSANAARFTDAEYGPASVVVPAFFERVLAESRDH